MNRHEILEAIKDDIITYIKPSNSPYLSEISEVKRGTHSANDIANRPFVGIAMLPDDLDDEEFSSFGGAQQMLLKVYVYCYMDTDGYGNYDTFHQLIRDLEYFFKYDFTYKKNTVTKKITPYEAGMNAPAAFFGMDLEIKYENTI